MPPGDPPPDDGTPDDGTPDAWEADPWDRDDWKRDPWKAADWGKPAAPVGAAPRGKKQSGLAAWNTGMMAAGPYLTLGLQSAFAMAFFVAVGYFVDGWLGSRPWGLIAGAVLGMVGVFTLLARLAKQANAETAARRRAGNRT